MTTITVILAISAISAITPFTAIHAHDFRPMQDDMGLPDIDHHALFEALQFVALLVQCSSGR